MANHIETYKKKLVEYLYKENNQLTRIFKQVEDKTQVKREYVALGSLVFIGLWLAFGYGAQLLCNLIGFVYPAYSSIRALESRNKEDDTRWLTYWVVFAVFSVCEFFSDILLSWFPLYWLAKCAFLTWCFMPVSWNGSDIIYARVIRPAFMKHQTKIDATMKKVSSGLNNIADTVEKVGSDFNKYE